MPWASAILQRNSNELFRTHLTQVWTASELGWRATWQWDCFWSKCGRDFKVHYSIRYNAVVRKSMQIGGALLYMVYGFFSKCEMYHPGQQNKVECIYVCFS